MSVCCERQLLAEVCNNTISAKNFVVSILHTFTNWFAGSYAKKGKSNQSLPIHFVNRHDFIFIIHIRRFRWNELNSCCLTYRRAPLRLLHQS